MAGQKMMARTGALPMRANAISACSASLNIKFCLKIPCATISAAAHPVTSIVAALYAPHKLPPHPSSAIAHAAGTLKAMLQMPRWSNIRSEG